MPRANGTIVSYDTESGEVVIRADRDGALRETSLTQTRDFFEPTKINPTMTEIGRPKIGQRIAFILVDGRISWWGTPDSTISG